VGTSNTFIFWVFYLFLYLLPSTDLNLEIRDSLLPSWAYKELSCVRAEEELSNKGEQNWECHCLQEEFPKR
jgi:hypothetical protein